MVKVNAINQEKRKTKISSRDVWDSMWASYPPDVEAGIAAMRLLLKTIKQNMEGRIKREDLTTVERRAHRDAAELCEKVARERLNQAEWALTQEPSLPIHSTDALELLAAWASYVRVGGRSVQRPTVFPIWTEAIRPVAVQETLERLERLVTAGDQHGADVGLELVATVDTWAMAAGAVGGYCPPGLTDAMNATIAGIEKGLFDELIGYVQAEVDTWDPQLDRDYPSLFYASRLWILIAARAKKLKE